MRRVAGLNYRTLTLGVAIVVLAGLVLGSVGIGAAVAGAVNHAPASHSTPAASHASPTLANQGQATTTIQIGLVYTPGETFPGNVTFWTNITYGVISNSTTFVSVIANGSTDHFVSATGNGTVNSHGVTTFTGNGIPYANYTWTVIVGQTQFTPNCANPQCQDVIGPSGAGTVNFTILVLEKGTSGGGGTAVNSYSWGQWMVGTQFTAGFLSPSTNDATMSTFTMFNPMNMSISFWLNTSQIALSNATQKVFLETWLNGVAAPTAFMTFNGTLNYTLSTPGGQSGAITAAGTAATGNWSNVTYSATLNAASLGYASWAAFVTALGTGASLNLVVGAIVTGIDAVGATGTAFNLTSFTGTTYASGGTFVQPGPYQPLPYTASGWLNLTYVAPDWATNGNASYSAFFELWDGKTNLQTWSANNSVNATNVDGVLFAHVSNGTTALGGTWTNYTWSITIAPGNVAGSSYGDALNLTVSVTVNGMAGALPHNTVANATAVSLATFVQFPTTVSTTFTTTGVTGYIDVSSAPFLLNWTIAVTNGAITPTATSVELQVVDATIPYPIMNYTIAVAPGQTAFSFPLTASTFTSCNTQVCGETAPTDDFYFTVIATENGVGGPTNGSVASSSLSIGPAFFIATPATITLLSPSGASPTLPSGNITFATLYLGNFVSGANLSVFSGNVVVFTAGMTQLTPGVPATAVWDATAPGTYNVVVTMSRTSGGPVFANQTLTITSSTGSLVYQNSSTYHNVTLLGSLSPAVAGTILLLVGLIVGMIVALLVGRMMWGGSKPQEPPQQWEQGQPASGSTESGTGSMESGSTDSGTPPSGSS
jgi:hypothetical protein